MAFLTNLLSFALVAVSGYALTHSAQSIPKLQKYEDKAKKAADWSNAADKRLWDTRYTVGAGFVMTLVSLVSAAYFLFLVPEGFGLRRIGWAAMLGGGEYFASQYMHSFWHDKAKIPLMDDYNDAISDTINVIGLSDALAAGWGAMTFMKLIGF